MASTRASWKMLREVWFAVGIRPKDLPAHERIGTPWKVGDKIRFRGEKQRYTVQACNDRFAILTKPFNCRRTVLYTIVDFVQQIRGTENLIFCMGFETRELCEEALGRLTVGDLSGKTEVSHRNRVPLEICGTNAA